MERATVTPKTIENDPNSILHNPENALIFQAACLLFELAENSENFEGEQLATCIEAKKIAQSLMNIFITC